MLQWFADRDYVRLFCVWGWPQLQWLVGPWLCSSPDSVWPLAWVSVYMRTNHVVGRKKGSSEPQETWFWAPGCCWSVTSSWRSNNISGIDLTVEWNLLIPLCNVQSVFLIINFKINNNSNKHLLNAYSNARPFACMSSFHPQSHSMWEVPLLSPFHTWDVWGLGGYVNYSWSHDRKPEFMLVKSQLLLFQKSSWQMWWQRGKGH